VKPIVDPQRLVEEQLKKIDAEFQPRLEATRQAVDDAAARNARRVAKRALRSVTREHRAARREVRLLSHGPVTWFVSRPR
jgi:hypothetical protein